MSYGQGDTFEMLELLDHLDEMVGSLRDSGRSRAYAENEYRKALAMFMVHERSKGTPVTGIPDLARGEPNIAQLRLTRDLADVEYDAAREALYVGKLRARILDNQIGREWSRPSNM